MECQPKPRHIPYLHDRRPQHPAAASPKKKPTRLKASHPKAYQLLRPAPAQAQTCVSRLTAAWLRRAHTLQAGHAPPTPTDLADRAAICLSKHARTILFSEAAHRRRRRWLRLATYGILEESRVASRRSLLVFRRGVRRCCEHERAAGASAAACWVAVCN